MPKYKTIVSIVALLLIAFGVNLERFGIDLEALTSPPVTERGTDTNRGEQAEVRRQQADKPANRNSLPRWSSTRPEINLWHVFEGEINRKGKPTGFHARPQGTDPANARVTAIKDQPNRLGVYTATVQIRDGREWKSKFSSFFPDRLSQRQVIEVILHAYRNSKNPNAQPWSGPSGMGFQVQGYTTSRGGINTAFPVYNANP